MCQQSQNRGSLCCMMCSDQIKWLTTMAGAVNWDGTRMPSQRGRVAVVTGANQGIGYECARQLAEHGAHVILACRNEERARKVVQDLRQHLFQVDDAGHVEYMIVDIGCMGSVKDFADACAAKLECIDVLINNAGVGVPPETTCVDGYPIQFGVNYLGHFYLTTLLFSLLQRSDAARVINVSSPAHRQQVSTRMCKNTKLDFTKLHKGEGDSGWERYEKSKLCCLVFSIELDRRLKAAGIHNVKSVGAQPGVCYTNIFNESAKTYFPRFMLGIVGFVYSYVMQTAYMGSLPLLYASTEVDVEGGEFFGPKDWGHWFGYPSREQPAAAAQLEEYGEGLWSLSERLTKTRFRL